MAHMINRQIKYSGKIYIIISYVESLDMFQAQEINRLFKTLIPIELIGIYIQ